MPMGGGTIRLQEGRWCLSFGESAAGYRVPTYYTVQIIERMREARALMLAAPPERVRPFPPGCSTQNDSYPRVSRTYGPEQEHIGTISRRRSQGVSKSYGHV